MFFSWYNIVLLSLCLNYLFQPVLFTFHHSLQCSEIMVFFAIYLHQCSHRTGLATFLILIWPCDWMRHIGDIFRDIAAVWSTAPAWTSSAEVWTNRAQMPSSVFSHIIVYTGCPVCPWLHTSAVPSMLHSSYPLRVIPFPTLLPVQITGRYVWRSVYLNLFKINNIECW